MDDARAWEAEERLWLEGAEAYADLLHPACVMAFVPPVGILRGEEIGRSLEGAPRWEAVAMTERTLARPDEGTSVLGYRARGRRAGSEPYEAFCTSTWRRGADGWRIVQHQQTPIG